jgi:type IX secretion system PorP/SprF family membrane protein
MRKLIVLIVIVFVSEITYSQQFPLQSQYQFNYSVINPAIIAENNYTSVRASFRQQWVGFSDNPIATQTLSLYKGYDRNGIGVNVFNDETGGAFNKSGLSLSYAHKINFPESEVFFGISGGVSKVNISNISDPSIINSDDVIPEVTFGAYLKHKDFRFGFSVPGLLNENMELTNSNENTLYSHLYTMVSYRYRVNESLMLLPSLLLKSTEARSQIDANVNLKVRDKIWVGASYRQDFGPSLYVGIDFGKLFSIYSHDITTNEAYSYSNGSHEFTIGYDFDTSLDSVVEKTIVKTDEFLFDIDRDGVKDSVDLCPNQFGSQNAHGCLDVDNDGIPNEYDLCPNLYGKSELQGCPEITQFEKNIVYQALNDLKFEFDKAEINYSSYPTLTDMNLLLLKNPKMFLHITGFSSSEGTAEYNLGLSARRAKAVQNFFIDRGIKKGRLILDYFGEANPLNQNKNEYEKSLNRRVEFSLEYHIYAIEESNKLKAEYKKALINKNLDYSFMNNNLTKILISDNNFRQVEKEEASLNEDKVFNEEIIYNDLDLSEDIIPSGDNALNSNKKDVKDSEDRTVKKINKVNLNDELTRYILVVAVLSNKENTTRYLSTNPLATYVLIEGKYYIYEISKESKEDLIKYKSTYNKESWIKKIN